MNQKVLPKPSASPAHRGAPNAAEAASYRRFCTQCRAHLEAGDRFCGRCGHTAGAAGERPRADAASHAPRAPSRPPFTPALKTPEGLAAATAIDARRATLTHVVRVSATVVVSGGLAAYLFTAKATSGPDALLFWAGGTAVAAAIAWLGINLRSWSERDYYAVPGSRDEQGEHRCIACGHRGIYRHGQYASNAEYANCAKCKTRLWVGTK